MTGGWLPTRVIGHRGAAAHAPENTLAGIAHAADLGIRMIEVDVKLSRDGIPVLFHDDTLNRTTNGKGAVAATDHTDLARLDAGSWVASGFSGERIPTLQQAIGLMIERGLSLNLEIKPCPGRGRETADIALTQALELWPDERPPPLVSSFTLESLETAQRVAPDWPRALLLESARPDWNRVSDRLEVASVNIAAGMATPVDVAGYKRGGRRCLAYTVNDAEEAATMLAFGVDAVISDCPDRIVKRLSRGKKG